MCLCWGHWAPAFRAAAVLFFLKIMFLFVCLFICLFVCLQLHVYDVISCTCMYYDYDYGCLSFPSQHII